MLKKGIILVVMLLFIGMSIVPSTTSNIAVEKSSKSTNKALMELPLPPIMWTEDFYTFYISTPQDPEGDQVYYLIDWGDGTSSGWIGPYEPGETVSISHEWNEEGTYQIKVKAKDQDGESKCAVYSLTLSSDLKFFGVETGYVDITYTFTIYWKGYECYIFIDWGDGGPGDWIGPYEQPLLFSHAWSLPGEYVLRFKIKDIFGNESDWITFIILIIPLDNNPPDAPDIEGPTVKPVPRPLPKQGEPINYTFKSTDPDGDNVSYYIDWGDGNYEDWFGPFESGEEVTRNHTWNEEGTYDIRAKAKDIWGAESDWGTLDVIMPKNQNMWFHTDGWRGFQYCRRY